ncbi:MAG: BON domain-containing protein [Pseudomonadota bacterium]|nr:BON domain-containing protein [Pseudomonadota bacterium]
MNTRLMLLLAVVVMTSNGVVWGANSETFSTAENSSPEANTSDAENTERNVRDKSDATLTPENQVEGDDGDRKITAEIRRAVVGDDSLSLNAQNVKIITLNRVVTLRGPVESEAEKTTIDKLARQAAGVTQVQNQLEIERQTD